jgi:hypothetical protein
MWGRDWCILGALSGLLAPVGMGLPLLAPAFCLVSAIVGALSGFLLGPMVEAGLRRIRGRFSPPLPLVGALLGLVWGALVGGAAGLCVNPPGSLDTAELGLVFGGISGATQMAWFLPAYVWGRLRNQCAGVLTLAGLFSPGLAWAGCLLIAVMVIPGAMLVGLTMRL